MVSSADIIIRLVLAFVLGGVIGIEREKKRRTAGLRTHVLVSMGSCLIMLTSIHIFDIYKGLTALDPARIAAGVVTGIGFLGGGAIIRSSHDVRGLTTAATIWVSAGIGLTAGAGFYLAAVVATLLSLVALVVLKKVEPRRNYEKEE